MVGIRGNRGCRCSTVNSQTRVDMKFRVQSGRAAVTIGDAELTSYMEAVDAAEWGEPDWLPSWIAGLWLLR